MSDTKYRVIKRHADGYKAIDYPDLTSYEAAVEGLLRHPLADGESLTIAREFADGAPWDRRRAWNRAVADETYAGDD